MNETENLQPWIDYFKMLQAYEKEGHLKINPQKHEAYVTLAALHAMSEGSDPKQQLLNGAIVETLRRIRAYAGYLSQQGEGYLKEDFAMHVVGNEAPYDLLYTLHLSLRRHRMPWQKPERIEIINYRS